MCCAAVALQKKNTWRHFNVIVKATQSKATYERTQTTHIPERVLYIRYAHALVCFINTLLSLCPTLCILFMRNGRQKFNPYEFSQNIAINIQAGTLTT